MQAYEARRGTRTEVREAIAEAGAEVTESGAGAHFEPLHRGQEGCARYDFRRCVHRERPLRALRERKARPEGDIVRQQEACKQHITAVWPTR